MADLEIVRWKEAVKIMGMCKTTLYEREKLGLVPKRVRTGPRSTGWYRHELEEYVKNLPRVTPQNFVSKKEEWLKTQKVYE